MVFKLEHVDDNVQGELSVSCWRSPELASDSGRAGLLLVLDADPAFEAVELSYEVPFGGRARFKPQEAGEFFARAFLRGSSTASMEGLFKFDGRAFAVRFREDRCAFLSEASAPVDGMAVAERANATASRMTRPRDAYGLGGYAQDGVLRGSAVDGLFDALQECSRLWRECGGRGSLGEFYAWTDRPLADSCFPDGVLPCDDQNSKEAAS